MIFLSKKKSYVLETLLSEVCSESQVVRRLRRGWASLVQKQAEHAMRQEYTGSP